MPKVPLVHKGALSTIQSMQEASGQPGAQADGMSLEPLCLFRPTPNVPNGTLEPTYLGSSTRHDEGQLQVAGASEPRAIVFRALQPLAANPPPTTCPAIYRAPIAAGPPSNNRCDLGIPALLTPHLRAHFASSGGTTRDPQRRQWQHSLPKVQRQPQLLTRHFRKDRIAVSLRIPSRQMRPWPTQSTLRFHKRMLASSPQSQPSRTPSKLAATTTMAVTTVPSSREPQSTWTISP